MSEVETAITHTTEIGVDGIVSFGGGSAIDAAKMIAVRLADRHGLAYRGLPHVAIPTTLSVAELAGGAGFTDAAGDKAGMRDVRLLLDSVIYDADLTLATRCIYGFERDQGARPRGGRIPCRWGSSLLGRDGAGVHPAPLRVAPAAKAAPDDIRIRTRTSWRRGSRSPCQGLRRADSATHGKQIGARHRIPHGVTSCLLMPTSCAIWREASRSGWRSSPRRRDRARMLPPTWRSSSARLACRSTSRLRDRRTGASPRR